MRTKDADVTVPDEPEMRVWQAISSIPKGRVTTYGTIASLAGLPGRARWIGYLLRTIPKDTRLPWHRIINASGKIAIRTGTGVTLQKALLEEEGIVLNSGRINLKKYGWPSD